MATAELVSPPRSENGAGYTTSEPGGYEFLRPLVTGWLSKIEEAYTARKGFDAVAQQCWQFFSGATDFMWTSEYQGKYMKGNMSPRFKICLHKAFELVALFGPSLYWRTPQRTFAPRKQIQFTPEMFGAQDDPQAQQLFQFSQEQDAQRQTGSQVRNSLYDSWLNYTPGETPDGGLALQSEMAITESLVAGRGVLWPKSYQAPGSQRMLTGCFFDREDNLLLDPDARSLQGAWWIAQRCCDPYWKVEREFKLEPDSLKRIASYESATSQAERTSEVHWKRHRAEGKTNDLLVYYKIWSKMGAGARLSGVESSLKTAFDKVVGDYAYLVVAPGVPFPLNAPSRKLKKMDDDAARKAFRWPIPFWTDSKWPCAVLEYYRHPKSAYPIGPMAPGLGELAYLNVFISHIAGRIWSSSRDFIAVLQEAYSFVEPVLKKGEDMCILQLPRLVPKIDEAIQFLQQPQLNSDAWEIIDRITALFERRTGLTELLYGLNAGGLQSRTATDAESKKEMVTIRPEYMASKVEEWQSELADMEKFVARMEIEAEDVKDYFGDVGAYLWETHVTSEPVELVTREMKAIVAAGSGRRPNKQKEAENINAALQVFFPELSKHADATFDTQPLNALIEKWGEAVEMDVSGMLMGPRQPQSDPAQEQMLQQQMQMEQAKIQADVQKSQAAIQKVMLDAQSKQQQTQMDMAAAQQQMQMDMQMGQQELAIKREEAQLKAQMEQLKLKLEQIKGQQAMQMEQQKGQQQLQMGQQEMQMDQARSQQEMAQDQQSHQQELTQSREMGQTQMALAKQKGQTDLSLSKQKGQAQTSQIKEQGKAKAQAVKQQAQARPKPQKPKPK
jgi:hypothetical protein